MRFGQLYDLLKQTGQAWVDDRVPQLGASLAFYCILSLGPILLLSLAGAGLVFGHEAAHGKIVHQIKDLVGEQGANAIQEILVNSMQEKKSGIIATIIGVITLLVGASGVFGQLQDALNMIWKVKIKPKQPLARFLKERFISLTMILGTGFLLLISLAISTALSFLSHHTFSNHLDLTFAMQCLNFIISFSVATVLFALIFRYVPEAVVKWQDVWVGAILTAFLFTIGKSIIGLYLGHSSFSSSYGAAGSLIVILIWVYYSSQILFFGAEFTKIYSRRRDNKLSILVNRINIFKKKS